MNFHSQSNSNHNSDSHKPDLFDAVKREIPIEEAYRILTGNDVPGSGSKRKIRCPDPSHHNHGDRDPSASLYLRDNSWWCHKRESGGDVIDLAMVTEGFHEFPEAARFLAERFSVDHNGADEKKIKQRRKKQNLLARFIAYAQKQITPEQKKEIRGRLGPCEYLEKVGFEPRGRPEDEETAKRIGLISEKDEKTYYLAARRFILPVYRHGKPVMVISYDPDAPKGKKYLNQSGWNTVLWGLEGADTNKPVYLVEGVFDYLSMRAAGLEAIGLFRAALKQDQLEKLKRLAPVDLRILLDAGAEESAFRVARKLWPEIRANVVHIEGPQDADPNKIWKEKAEFDAIEMKDTLRTFEGENCEEGETILDRKLEQISSATGIDEKRLKKDLFELIRPLDNSETGMAAGRMAKATGMRKKDIIKDVKQLRRKNGSSSPGSGDDPDTYEEKTLPTRISEYIQESATLFHDQRKDPHVKIEFSRGEDVARRVVNVDSELFNDFLYIKGKQINAGNVPNQDAVNSAKRDLTAIARQLRDETKLFNRVAKTGEEEAIWIDMCDTLGRAVKVTPGEFRIIDDPPTLFRRWKHMQSHVTPDENGDPWDLFEFVRIPEDKQLLILCWLITCFVQDIQHPMPILQGEPGSGKSWACRWLRQTVDPSHSELLKCPRDAGDLTQQFDQNWMPFFDNMRKIPAWLSDMFCQAVTGVGVQMRLYTDEDAKIRKYRRCIGMNGVSNPAGEPDLIDRAILVEIEKREDNVSLSTQRRAFRNGRPVIFGGMLSTLADAYEIKQTRNLDIPNTGRFVGFVRWGYAIAEALGAGGEAFLTSYRDELEGRVEEAIQSSPLGKAVSLFMENRETWEGTTTATYKNLKEVAEETGIDTDQKGWPSGRTWLWRKLKPALPMLRKDGIEAAREDRNDSSYITFRGKSGSNSS